MEINSENYSVGNKAMANVLLLYFHILSEGGITNDQTVYLDTDSFDPYALVNATVSEGASVDIDQALIRQGAMVYWVCEINDIVGEYDDSFHSHPYFTEVFENLKEHCSAIYPEVTSLLELLAAEEDDLNYQQYNSAIKAVFKKYVFERMQSIVWQSEL